MTLKTSETGLKAIAEHIFSAHCKDLARLNENLLNGFLAHRDDAAIKRTHLFNNRYENIYLDENHIPELSAVIDQARHYASIILEKNSLKAGYWFNDMPAGAVTTLHRHDDDDELLSAAYYVAVPANSGDLILHPRSGPVRITPEAGSFIFFYPDVPHEVTKNLSRQNRLSIGINFGSREPGIFD